MNSVLNFNSNFNCPCQTTCQNEIYKKNFVLDLTKYKINDPKSSDGPDPDSATLIEVLN